MSLNKAFREIGKVRTERSAFDLSHTNLSTHNGFTIPCHVQVYYARR